jgi:hypothetical protein
MRVMPMQSSSLNDNTPIHASVPSLDQGGLMTHISRDSTILWNPDDDGSVPFAWCNLYFILNL